jgi:hypothetical protein
MYRIYACAAYVTVWLGDKANDSFSVFESLRRAVKENSHQRLSEQVESLASSLQMLLCRPWFERVWVRKSAEILSAPY